MRTLELASPQMEILEAGAHAGCKQRCTEGSVLTPPEYLAQRMLLESDIFMPKQIFCYRFNNINLNVLRP